MRYFPALCCCLKRSSKLFLFKSFLRKCLLCQEAGSAIRYEMRGSPPLGEGEPKGPCSITFETPELADLSEQPATSARAQRYESDRSQRSTKSAGEKMREPMARFRSNSLSPVISTNSSRGASGSHRCWPPGSGAGGAGRVQAQRRAARVVPG